MKTKTSAFIAEVNAEMELFSAALKIYAHQEYERVQNMGDDVNNDQEQLSDQMITLLGEDPDFLNGKLEGSKENIELRVNDIESQIIRELTNDWKQTEHRIIEEQHHRNRTIVQEIIKTCEKFKKEISKFPIPFIHYISNSLANLSSFNNSFFIIDNEVDAIEKEKNPYA